MRSVPVQRWVLPTDLTAAFSARRHVEGACEGMSADTVDTARLLVTELVSNAVLHAEGAVVLTIANDHEGIRVEVHDQSPRMPVILEGQPPLEHGNGLRLVAALATSWGADTAGDIHPGKLVWFTLAQERRQDSPPG